MDTELLAEQIPDQCLTDVELFSLLNDTDNAWLDNRCARREFKKGDFIKAPGEPCNYIYVLKKGMVNGGIHSSTGKEMISSILKPRDMFGLLSIMPNAKEDFFYQALEDCTVGFIRTEDLKGLLSKNAKLCYKVLETLGNRLLDLETKQYHFMFADIRGRLANLLIFLARDLGQTIGDEILVKHNLTQQQMANIIGVSRQTVTGLLSEWKKQDIVYLPDRTKLLIRDISKLEQMVP